jgi:Uma2 family endonuclease
MAGGTIRHAGIQGNLYGAVRDALRGRPCRPFGSDCKVRIPDTGLATYPDLSVICGPPLVQVDFPRAAINPILLAEVLSDSTEAWDRGGKFAHYRRLPSLQYYLLVSQEPQRVELYSRSTEGAWTLTEYAPGTSVPLPLLGVTLPVDALYEDLVDEELV